MSDPINLVFFFAAILVVAALVFLAISITQKKPILLDKESYQTRWLAIEQTLNKDVPATFSTTIMDSDKLLDRALSELGVKGNGLGDRLKASKEKFSSINSVWHAHKLRNQIAHQHDFKPSYTQASHALDTFKQALKDIGAI